MAPIKAPIPRFYCTGRFGTRGYYLCVSGRRHYNWHGSRDYPSIQSKVLGFRNGAYASHTSRVSRYSVPNYRNATKSRTPSDCVTLANGNEVSGFNITRTFGNGIIGNSVTNILLDNNTIFGSMASGINLQESASANLIINDVTLLNNLNGLTLTAASDAAVNIAVTNCNISVNGNPSILPSGDGLSLFSQDTATIIATVTNNTFQNNQNNGIRLDSTSNSSSPLAFNISNNQLIGNSFSAIEGTFTGDVVVSANLLHNSIIGNYGVFQSNTGTVSLSFQGANPCNVTITDNEILRNTTGAAVYLQAGIADFTALLTNNTIDENCNWSFNFNNIGTATSNLVIDGNQMIGNCYDGILITSSVLGSSLNLTVSNNTIRGDCGNGISLTDNGTISFHTLNFIATNNVISGNCGDGIKLNLVDTDLTATITGNTFANNNGSGVFISQNTGPTNITNVTVSQNTITSNQVENHSPPRVGNGIEFDYLGSSTETALFTATDNTITYNENNGISINATPNGSGELSLTIANNTLSYSLQNGLNIFANPSSSFDFVAAITKNTLNNNALNGINVSTEGQVNTFTIDAQNNVLANNNPFTSPVSPSFQVTTNSNTETLCLNLVNNTSDTGYLLTNILGTFNLAPLNVSSVNSGPITEVGVTHSYIWLSLDPDYSCKLHAFSATYTLKPPEESCSKS